ncbi:PQQ-binding-like beta-propeller repeat protein [Planctomicrobium piriforme]|uniref:Outer membrane protein assembly factor BamB, contains PQQ-like beta-propeller repeat n=1 Tax=Planctomicrobium piriforme TaxID=1576369 RepID=A0A1I3R6N5_9PLAN|nr:PQQ-binding-like beta-propeller repeat protein [Planctomicrobium piriforme]SFJ42263.1 Outer membrane protein assembly factor BamB, contains PQQ-like beta-propeller repeat [Planctomicrobium piriforme]
MPIREFWIVPLVLCACFSAQVNGAEPLEKASWPNWMGPNRDGISTESDWSTAWQEKGLPVAWSRQIGIGFSSVSVADGRLFTMGHIDGEEVVWCLNPETGEELWSYRYPGALIDNLHEGGPGSTPTVEDNHVYALGKEGQLHCLDAQIGKVIWHKELRQDLDIPLPEWGFASSAVIHGDQVLFEGGRVVSFDKHTGEKNWQTPQHAAGYGSAAIFQEQPGGILTATLDCEGLRILDVKTGHQIAFEAWESPFRTNSTTPIIQGNRIFISAGYNVGCGLFELDGTQLKKVYANREMRNHFNNSILWNGYLYGFDGNSNLGRVVQLTCMNFKTGEVAWRKAGFGCGSLIIVDGKLLLLNETGTLVLAKASPEGYEELARSPFLDGRCWTVPVFCNKKIYGRNAAGKLICIDVAAR